jgi:hypothetical protein
MNYRAFYTYKALHKQKAKQMDMYDYSRLTIGEKASLLWQQAIYLERFSDEGTTSNLYHLRNFFIEAVVSHKENRIVEVVPFKLGQRLEKYLDRVHLKDLIRD